MTLFDLLANSAAAAPDTLALQCQGRELSYRELASAVEGFAGGLAALPIGKRVRIAVLLPNCPAFVISYFAAGRAGATLVPLNILYRPDEARYILADAEAEVLITAEPFRPLVRALRPLLPRLQQVIMVAEHGAIADDELDFFALCAHRPRHTAGQRKHEVAVILYTSGTTGRPKGAMLTHHNLIANATSCTELLQVTSADRFATALPLFHSFAALMCMVLPVKVGASMHIAERFTPQHALNQLEQTRATFYGGVPSMFALMLPLAREHQPDLSALRVCVSGGAPLPPELMRAFETACDVRMVEGYGLTEAAPVVAVNPPFGVRKPGSIGLPIPQVQVKIVDEHDHPVAAEHIGQLAVKGENVMKGYLHRPAETLEVLRHGWLYTGDLARMDADGYLYIAGRQKELIIVGGLNVYPGEIERVLVEHPAIMEVAAFGIPDSTRGEAAWAVVVLRPGQQVSVKTLRAHCREKLAGYKVPRGIEILPELPKNALGKVQRHVLHNMVVQQLDQQTVAVLNAAS